MVENQRIKTAKAIEYNSEELTHTRCGKNSLAFLAVVDFSCRDIMGVFGEEEGEEFVAWCWHCEERVDMSEVNGLCVASQNR